MIYRDIYRAIEWDGKYIMTNRVEALFLCRALGLMRLIWARRWWWWRGGSSSALFQTLLPTPSVTFIGIILSLASLWHLALLERGSGAPCCSLQNANYTATKKVSEGVRCLRQTCSLCVARWHVRCPVLYTPSDVMLPTHSPPLSLPPPLFKALMPQWESRGSPCVWSMSGQLC